MLFTVYTVSCESSWADVAPQPEHGGKTKSNPTQLQRLVEASLATGQSTGAEKAQKQ